MKIQKWIVFLALIFYLVLAQPSPAFAWVSSAAGGRGGSSFDIRCRDDFVLVGILGRAGDWLDRVKGHCAEREHVADWITLQINYSGTSLVGGGGGDEDFVRFCPEGQAVSGISGREGWYVNRLLIYCTPYNDATGQLSSNRHTAVTGGAVGGNGGVPYGPYYCPDFLPGKGFLGKAGAYVDRIALICDSPDA